MGEICFADEIPLRGVKSASTADGKGFPEASLRALGVPVGGFHFTERASVRFHLRAKPEDFTFCRKAKDFTFFDVWHTNVLLAVICDEKTG